MIMIYGSGTQRLGYVPMVRSVMAAATGEAGKTTLIGLTKPV